MIASGVPNPTIYTTITDNNSELTTWSTLEESKITHVTTDSTSATSTPLKHSDLSSNICTKCTHLQKTIDLNSWFKTLDQK